MGTLTKEAGKTFALGSKIVTINVTCDRRGKDPEQREHICVETTNGSPAGDGSWPGQGATVSEPL